MNSKTKYYYIKLQDGYMPKVFFRNSIKSQLAFIRIASVLVCRPVDLRVVFLYTVKLLQTGGNLDQETNPDWSGIWFILLRYGKYHKH